MEKRRTVPVKLHVNSDDAALLRDTLDAQTAWLMTYHRRSLIKSTLFATKYGGTLGQKRGSDSSESSVSNVQSETPKS
jgi:hypothetical protein